MEQTTKGIISSARQLWFIKINTKAVRSNSMDGAIFPSVIKVTYTVNGTDYCKRKFLSAYVRCPNQGESVTVFYQDNKPAKSRIELQNLMNTLQGP